MPPKQAPSSANDSVAQGEPFSDASSSYWPEGWNWARFSDPDADFFALSEEDRERMRQGLQEVLGDDGMRNLDVHLRIKARQRELEKLRQQGAPPPPYRAPDFLKRWRTRPGRGGGGPWGFFAFRTALYDDETGWTEFKRRVGSILQVPFDRVVDQHDGHEYEDVAEGRKAFELHWVEDRELDGASAETLRERYVELKKQGTFPTTDYDMFLCASPEAIESVLSLDPANLPTINSSFWRDDAPFLLTVLEETEVNPHGDEEGDYDPDDQSNERNWYKSVFKVPVEIVPDSLWELAESAYVPPARLTRAVKGSTELGGTMPHNFMVDGLTELWWGMGPSPASLKRRRGLRGF